MPYNGDINTKFGAYKSLCCGEEIIIPEGKEFPDCPNHRNLTTIWKPVSDDRIVDLTNKPKDSAA